MARPYRSHKIPACDACRKRKVRCDLPSSETACRRCRRMLVACSFQDSESTNASLHDRCLPASDLYLTSEIDSSARTKLLVGPTVAEDVQILETYLASNRQPTQEDQTPYHAVLSSDNDAVVYISVPRSRAGLSLAKDPGREQLHAINQILGTSQEELYDLFTKQIHPHFPIVDLQAFRQLDEGGFISSTLLCYILNSALHLWETSTVLARRPRPDTAVMSNLAVAALQSDFMAPTLSTIAAAVLDLLGRPIRSVTTNILTIGKMVALAHSFGLHRDPTQWTCTEEEKSLRKRLWWSVVIHDRWGSYANGTPPNISSDCYDVAVLDATDWASIPDDPTDGQMAVSCTHFCYLTQSLSELLTLVHSLRTVWQDVPKTLRKVECALDDWEVGLRRLCSIDPREKPPNGHCSLWFSFLSVKLLIQRLYLRAAALQTTFPAEAEKQYRTMSLRESAVAIVDFVNSLQSEHFGEFWFSYSAHFLVSSTIMLLRCMIETKDPGALSRCQAKLVCFRQKIHDACTQHGWDIAEMCIERCSGAIDQVIRPFEDVNCLDQAFPGASSSSDGPQTLFPGVDLLDLDWFAQSDNGLNALLSMDTPAAS